MTGYRRIMRLVGRGGDVRRELDEELESHVEMRAAELERQGLSPAAARQEAERRLGSRKALYASARGRAGRVRRAEWLDSLRADVVAQPARAARTSCNPGEKGSLPAMLESNQIEDLIDTGTPPASANWQYISVGAARSPHRWR